MNGRGALGEKGSAVKEQFGEKSARSSEGKKNRS